MKARPEDQKRLLELAAVDAETRQIAHRRKNLPERIEVERIEDERNGHRDAAATLDITLEDFDRDIAKLEGEVDAVGRRAARNDERLASGGVPPRQLSEMQHENNSLARRRSELEEELLEVMEQREAVEHDRDRTGALIDRAEDELADARRHLEQAEADLQTAEDRSAGHRAELVADLPEDLLALYERERTRTGIGAALLQARRCGGCRIELDRMEIARIAALDPEEVVHCDQCSTVLVRTNESGLG